MSVSTPLTRDADKDGDGIQPGEFLGSEGLMHDTAAYVIQLFITFVVLWNLLGLLEVLGDANKSYVPLTLSSIGLGVGLAFAAYVWLRLVKEASKRFSNPNSVYNGPNPRGQEETVQSKDEAALVARVVTNDKFYAIAVICVMVFYFSAALTQFVRVDSVGDNKEVFNLYALPADTANVTVITMRKYEAHRLVDLLGLLSIIPWIFFFLPFGQLSYLLFLLSRHNTVGRGKGWALQSQVPGGLVGTNALNARGS
jgi:hypothetical protein